MNWMSQNAIFLMPGNNNKSVIRIESLSNNVVLFGYTHKKIKNNTIKRDDHALGAVLVTKYGFGRKRPVMSGLLGLISHGQQLVLLLLLLSGTTAAQPTERPVFVYALNQQSLPFEANSITNRAIGFNIDLMRDIADTMNFAVEFRAMPLAQVLQQLQTGEVDMATIISSPERDALFDFAKPHHLSPVVMIVRDDNAEIYRLEDLQNKEVVAIKGGFAHRHLLAGQRNLVTVADIKTGLTQLSAGHHDAMLTLQSIALYQIQQHKLTNMVITGSVGSAHAYSFAVTKGNRALLAQINEGMSILRRNGTFQQLHEKWLGGGRTVEQEKQALIVFFIITLLIILILGLVLWKWKTEETREQLERAHHDALTGLPARALLMDRLEHALSHTRRTGASMAVLFIDLDGFKSVNDTLGHAAGDLLLQMVAKRLLYCMREEDTVARFGGDEFVIVLENIDHVGDIDMIADRILETLQQPFTVVGQQVCISGSLGVSLYPQNGTNADSLLRHADEAMYQAKKPLLTEADRNGRGEEGGIINQHDSI
ncbi:diguanylate cyclase [uncultured Oceanisphaera sp.]|uniref:diguanylate cyclase domain-containing protein n=1 Tax=uncultured Oceanisphaera sp. TaxID=353858 RepID=UPI00260329E0|nr:diguanylate cyclase [uncultured Oceanisphaera sp.]